MLKNRVFLIGLGAGIIIGALLFQLMLSGEESRQRLNDMGKEMDEKLYTQLEVDALLKAERDSAKLNQATKTSKETEVVQPTIEADPAKKQTSEGKADKAVPTSVPVKEVPAVKHVIQIKTGSNLTQTADLLADQNIIKDKDKATFMSKMKKSKKLVRAGYFLIQEKITVDEAIAVVTSDPLTRSEVNLLKTSNKNN